MSLFDDIQKAGIPYRVRSVGSDLYIPVTPETTELLARHGIRATTFENRVDGGLWYDVPFAYDPWWKEREQRG